MPTINSISISVTSQQYVYHAGDVISGQWCVDAGECFSAKSCRLSLNGAALTRWDNTKTGADDNIGFEDIVKEVKTVWGSSAGPCKDFPAGKQTFHFRFQFPGEMLPSSYEGKYGAIRYWLALEIVRPVLRSNIKRIKTVTVLDSIDVNLPEYNTSNSRKVTEPLKKFLGVLGKCGDVTLHAQTDRRGYCPGEKIYISALLDNKTDRLLAGLRAILVQEVEFRASGETKYKTTNINTLSGKEVKAGEQRCWKRQALSIPACPPSTRQRSSYIIRVQYVLKVIVTIPKLQGGDVYVRIPVTIGTIPQGHVTGSPQQAGANDIHVPVVDASTALTYTQCTTGIDECDVTESRFTKTTYVPYCTFVPDFEARQRQRRAIQAHAPTTQQRTSQGAASASGTRASASSAKNAPVKAAVKQPTAPPQEAMPPSYDDVMREIQNKETESTTERQSSDDESQTNSGATGSSAAKDTVGGTSGIANSIAAPTKMSSNQKTMLITFPDVKLREFRAALVTHARDLEANDGKVIAVSPQILVMTGSWPAHTSLAVLAFETEDSAVTWYRQFETTCTDINCDLTNVILFNRTTEDIVTEKGKFVLNITKKTGDVKSPDYKTVVKLVRTVYKPSRYENGGVLLHVGGTHAQLLGCWQETDNACSLTQWDSFSQFYEYKSQCKARLKELNYDVGLIRQFFEAQLSVAFQTESLAYIEEAGGLDK